LISDDDIRRVREATDLVDLVSEIVVLKPRGREFWGRCPFHEEKTPSFKVDPQSQLYHCFGCHAGGDAFGFIMRTQSIEFLEAVRALADRANITITETSSGLNQGRRARLLALMSASAEFYSLQLLRSTTSGATAARSYLSGRQMGTDLAKRWQLGFAPGGTNLYDHLRKQGYTLEECLDANMVVKGTNGQFRDRFYERVMFPVADLQGRVIAFGGRAVQAVEPKYLNTSETTLFRKRETLYALDRAKAHITSQGTAIVVEGYTDTIAMHEAGFLNTIATLGTALTMQHLKMLNRFAKKVIYLFDGDEAGRRAAVRAAELINRDITPEAGKFRVSLEVAELPQGTDPADLLAREGTAALQQSLSGAMPLLKYAIQQNLKNADTSSPEGRSAALRSALSVLLPIRGSILANDYIADELAAQLGVDYQAATTLFNSLPEPRTYMAPSEPGPAGSTGGSGSEQALAGSAVDLGATNAGSAHEGGGNKGSALNNTDAKSQTTSVGLQCELIILFIEYPEVRAQIAEAFERIAWSSEELAQLAQSLGGAAKQQPEKEELYTLALSLAPAYTSVFSMGMTQGFSGSVSDYMYLLTCMLEEIKLQNEIALAKIAYNKAASNEEEDALFREIAQKQSQLATIRESLAEIPKTTW